jgi:hypothetical protein
VPVRINHDVAIGAIGGARHVELESEHVALAREHTLDIGHPPASGDDRVTSRECRSIERLAHPATRARDEPHPSIVHSTPPHRSSPP